MNLSIGAAIVTIFRNWTDFKKVIDGTEKSLQIQFEQDTRQYLIFALDNCIFYYTDIFKAGFEPASWSAQEITDNGTYRNDFINNYQTSSNRQSQTITIENSTRAKRIDLSDAIDYIGFAVVGSLESEAKWTIKRITKVGGDPEKIEWTAENIAVWNDRATETYS